MFNFFVQNFVCSHCILLIMLLSMGFPLFSFQYHLSVRISFQNLTCVLEASLSLDVLLVVQVWNCGCNLLNFIRQMLFYWLLLIESRVLQRRSSKRRRSWNLLCPLHSVIHLFVINLTQVPYLLQILLFLVTSPLPSTAYRNDTKLTLSYTFQHTIVITEIDKMLEYMESTRIVQWNLKHYLLD